MGELRDEIGDVSLIDPQKIKNTKPLEEVTPIFIHPNLPDRHVMIETELTEKLQDALVEF